MSSECKISTWKWPEILTYGRVFSLSTPLNSSFQGAPKVSLPLSSISQDKKVVHLSGNRVPHAGNRETNCGNREPHWGKQVPDSENLVHISGDRRWPFFPISGNFWLKVQVWNLSCEKSKYVTTSLSLCSFSDILTKYALAFFFNYRYRRNKQESIIQDKFVILYSISLIF